MRTWLLVLVVYASGCLIDRKSSDFACEVPADCMAGRTCSNGYCVVVDAGVPNCPIACLAAGGTCANATTCRFQCATGNSCPGPIVCPPGMACDVTCGAQGACAGGVSCGAATSCKIACSASNTCGGQIMCGSGPCDVTCSAQSTCGGGVSCLSSCACDVQCSGNNSCGMPASCPGAATCKIAPGCTSSPAGCNTCP